MKHTLTVGRVRAEIAELEPLEQRRLFSGSGAFQFDPLAVSVVATPGGNPERPLILPAGFTQTIIASEPQYAGNPDMNVLNETGPQAGRYLFQPHELGTGASVSRIDLWTGDVQTIASRSDWSDLDGSVWTPWGTLLVSEEHTGGMIWEINPWTGAQTALPAVGLAPHEGIRFDSEGNLYTISEQNPGYIFKFTPDVKGDLSSGQLYALKVTQPTGDRVGAAEWVALDRQAVQVDAGAAATAVGATGYNRPEDVEISTSTGNWRGRQTMFVAVTGPGDNRVIAIDLQPPHSRGDRNAAYVYDYVKPGLNAPADFEWPDNVALDKSGNLYITEDPGGSSASGKVKGDDIWVAEPGHGQHTPASDVVRFATLTDADAEPTGIYFDKNGSTLFVNIQHRGGDGLDKTLAITPDHGPGGHPFTFGPGSSSVFGEGLIGQGANDHLNDVLRDVAE